MFIATLFIITKTWKQPKCPSTDEWFKKMRHTYTMEYYSIIKTNKILPFAATWMGLENIMLSEISQTEKDKYYIILYTCYYKIKAVIPCAILYNIFLLLIYFIHSTLCLLIPNP